MASHSKTSVYNYCFSFYEKFIDDRLPQHGRARKCRSFYICGIVYVFHFYVHLLVVRLCALQCSLCSVFNSTAREVDSLTVAVRDIELPGKTDLCPSSCVAVWELEYCPRSWAIDTLDRSHIPSIFANPIAHDVYIGVLYNNFVSRRGKRYTDVLFTTVEHRPWTWTRVSKIMPVFTGRVRKT